MRSIHPLQNIIHVSKVHCRSAFEPGASGLPYNCRPPVCVPYVLGALAVWRQNIGGKEAQGSWTCEDQLRLERVAGYEVFVACMVMVAAGAFQDSAGVTADGALLICRRGADGQLGNGDVQTRLRLHVTLAKLCVDQKGTVWWKAGGDGRLRGITHNVIDGELPVDLPRRKTWQNGAR